MRALAILAAVLLAACDPGAPTSAPSVEPTPTATATPTAAPTPASTATARPTPAITPYSGPVQFPDGTSIHVVCAGQGEPAIILDNGLGGSVADWDDVIPAVAETTRVCAYNRIGVPPSSAATEPRTTSDIVADLRRLLPELGIDTPVVLVGHSIAGLDLRLHAGRYPEDVAGLLFVDPASPDLDRAWLAVLPEPAQGEPELLTRFRHELQAGAPGADRIGERYDIRASAADVLAVTDFRDIPTIVLSAGVGPFAAYQGPIGDALDDVWLEAHEQLAKLSTNGRVELVEGAAHSIQRSHPGVVAAAIAELVDKARSAQR